MFNYLFSPESSIISIDAQRRRIERQDPESRYSQVLQVVESIKVVPPAVQR